MKEKHGCALSGIAALIVGVVLVSFQNMFNDKIVNYVLLQIKEIIGLQFIYILVVFGTTLYWRLYILLLL
jgi:hypothetical protein